MPIIAINWGSQFRAVGFSGQSLRLVPFRDEEYMDARPDKVETEEAIENVLSRLEKQEERGFRDLKTLLSELPLPQPSRTVFVSVRGNGGWFPPQTGLRCGGYVHAVRITFVPSCTRSQVRT